MWQSKRIKHWLGSTSQNVIVNRKSKLRGSISRGVSEIALEPQMTKCFKSGQAENSESVVGVACGTMPHSDLGRSMRWSRETPNSPESPSAQIGKVWLQPASFCCSHSHVAASGVQEHMLLWRKEEKQQ